MLERQMKKGSSSVLPLGSHQDQQSHKVASQHTHRILRAFDSNLGSISKASNLSLRFEWFRIGQTYTTIHGVSAAGVDHAPNRYGDFLKLTL